jgi:hypothetical protein
MNDKSASRMLADRIETVLASHRDPMRVTVIPDGDGYVAAAGVVAPEWLRQIELATGASVTVDYSQGRSLIRLR